jgi:hypothetical protein
MRDPAWRRGCAGRSSAENFGSNELPQEGGDTDGIVDGKMPSNARQELLPANFDQLPFFEPSHLAQELCEHPERRPRRDGNRRGHPHVGAISALAKLLEHFVRMRLFPTPGLPVTTSAVEIGSPRHSAARPSSSDSSRSRPTHGVSLPRSSRA